MEKLTQSGRVNGQGSIVELLGSPKDSHKVSSDDFNVRPVCMVLYFSLAMLICVGTNAEIKQVWGLPRQYGYIISHCSSEIKKRPENSSLLFVLADLAHCCGNICSEWLQTFKFCCRAHALS